jgi:hypothetical protein
MKKLFCLPVLARLAMLAMLATVMTGMMGTVAAFARAGEPTQTAPERASQLQVTYYFLPG